MNEHSAGAMSGDVWCNSLTSISLAILDLERLAKTCMLGVRKYSITKRTLVTCGMALPVYLQPLDLGSMLVAPYQTRHQDS